MMMIAPVSTSANEKAGQGQKLGQKSGQKAGKAGQHTMKCTLKRHLVFVNHQSEQLVLQYIVCVDTRQV